MSRLLDAKWRWKEGGGYYTQQAAELERAPRLPNLERRRERQIVALFDMALAHAGGGPHPRVLELGCGASFWLAHLALRGCRVVGIDLEPRAAALAQANLKGAGATGEVICGNAFAPADKLVAQFDVVYSMGLMEHFPDVVTLLREVRRYLKPRGQIITAVPNFQGVNWWLQRLGSREILDTHVVYSEAHLRHCHEQAGFTTRSTGYLGFYDGFLSAARPGARGFGAALHRALCRSSNRLAAAVGSVTRPRPLPDLPWLAPIVYYLGRDGGA